MADEKDTVETELVTEAAEVAEVKTETAPEPVAEKPAKAEKAAKAEKKAYVRIVPRLQKKYRSEIKAELQKEFGFKNVHQVPGLTKIVVNMGVGEAAKDGKLIDGAVKELTLITGQKPKINLASKSIAQFKLREGQAIGAHVTLRGDRMWEFLDRLLNLALPRIRDFRGLNPNQFDGNGNYTFGLTEQNVFHEISQDDIDRVRGMDITIVTTAKTNDEGRALLTALGFPFKKPNN
ncbi:MAG: 50S ribosomal protein L5 [Actinomycetota bacterium]